MRPRLDGYTCSMVWGDDFEASLSPPQGDPVGWSGSLMPVHFGHSLQQGQSVYDSGVLVYCQARISKLRDLQLGLR